MWSVVYTFSTHESRSCGGTRSRSDKVFCHRQKPSNFVLTMVEKVYTTLRFPNLMDIKIIKQNITKKDLEKIAQNQFADFVKAVVDVEQKIMAIGGELHADAEAVLLAEGSRQENLWGINLYFDTSVHELIEFNSMINIRPSLGNRSRGVENPELQEKIREVVDVLVLLQ